MERTNKSDHILFISMMMCRQICLLNNHRDHGDRKFSAKDEHIRVIPLKSAIKVHSFPMGDRGWYPWKKLYLLSFGELMKRVLK